MLLHRCPNGATVEVTSIDVLPRYQLRVHELGIRPGVRAKILRKVPPNGMVLNVAGSRIAVDTYSARNIEVEVITQP